LDGKYKTQVITAGDTITVVEWSVDLLFNSLKMPSGMIITRKTL